MDNKQQDPQPAGEIEQGIAGERPQGIADSEAVATSQFGEGGPLAGNGDR